MVDAAAFVVAWMKAHNSQGTVKNVADELGIEINSVKLRAKSWKKKHGIELPKLKDYDVANCQKGRKLNAADMTALIASLTPQQQLIQQMTEAPANVVLMEGQSLLRTEEDTTHAANIEASVAVGA
jgi:hypothetical protein